MMDPGKKRNIILTNLISLTILLVLIYALYRISGGDISALFRPETYAGGGDPISQLVESLRSFGQGLRDSFGGMLR